MYRGRLIKGIGGFYYVDVEGEIFECKPRGLFRKKNIVILGKKIWSATKARGRL